MSGPMGGGGAMTGVCPEEYIEIANRLADASGAVIRPHFRSGIAVADKPDLSPVTAADEAAEREIRRILEDACPGTASWARNSAATGRRASSSG